MKTNKVRILEAYQRTKSCRQAAEAVGCSPSWVWKVVKAAGLIEKPVTEHSIGMLKEATQLYVDEQLSCRDVSKRLRTKYGASAPSQQWVCERMKRAGVLRSKSETNRIWQARKYNIDYVEAETEAYRLYTELNWSTRRIAEHLGVSRHVITNWLREDGVLRSISKANETVCWKARSPAMQRRWARAMRAGKLRAEGASYVAIAAANQCSVSTVTRDLEVVRLGRVRQRSAYRASRYRGVHWNRNAMRWVASITVAGKRIYIGSYKTSVMAARAYDEVAVKHGLLDRVNLASSLPEMECVTHEARQS